MLLVGSNAFSLLNSNEFVSSEFDFIGHSDNFKELVKKIVSSGEQLKKLHFGDSSGYAIFDNLIIDCMFTDKNTSFSKSNAEVYAYAFFHLDSDIRKIQLTCSVSMHIIVPVMNLLYMLKMSHRYRKDTNAFSKTMTHIRKMREHGCFIPEGMQEVYENRMQATYESQKKYKLNTEKKNFFTDNVPYKYDHDSIHRAVALGDVPAYTLYLSDEAEVMCSKEKFDALDYYTKLCGVYEEAAVLALERAVIPHDTDPDKAFMIALEKVCTSITSGWFREFAWENYNQVMNSYWYTKHSPSWYVNKFTKALNSGQILDYKGNTYA